MRWTIAVNALADDRLTDNVLPDQNDNMETNSVYDVQMTSWIVLYVSHQRATEGTALARVHHLAMYTIFGTSIFLIGLYSIHTTRICSQSGDLVRKY